MKKLYNYLISQRDKKSREVETSGSYFECKTVNYDVQKIREEQKALEKKIQETDFEISELNSIEFDIDI